MTSAMEARLIELGALTSTGLPKPGLESIAALYAKYDDDAGAARTRVARARDRGFDIGYGCGPDYAAPPAVQQRLDANYAQARAALFATIASSVVRDACVKPVAVHSTSADRDDYLNRPATGERVRDDGVRALGASDAARAPGVQIVVSDGLNANAVNQNLTALLPPLRRLLAGVPCRVSDADVVIQNGRVRAGYHVGGIVNADVVVHIIGERPGTGLDTLSAYLTYGRDEGGRARWDPALDHSNTNAVCGIHPNGKPPATAASEIAGLVSRMFEQRRSGVALAGDR
jgi:ethanolamine ammonia-lyase small subunit